jgi:hypothetical protein
LLRLSHIARQDNLHLHPQDSGVDEGAILHPRLAHWHYHPPELVKANPESPFGYLHSEVGRRMFPSPNRLAAEVGMNVLGATSSQLQLVGIEDDEAMAALRL